LERFAIDKSSWLEYRPEILKLDSLWLLALITLSNLEVLIKPLIAGRAPRDGIQKELQVLTCPFVNIISRLDLG
jgi:hypothetical protein